MNSEIQLRENTIIASPLNPPNDSNVNSVSVQKQSTPQEICEAVLGTVDWTTDDEGFVSCPGRHLHTGNNGPRDCKVYLSPKPTLKCFHSSCSDQVKEKSKELRAAINNSVPVPKRRLTREEYRRIRRAAFLRDVGVRARNGKDRLLKEFAWPLEEIKMASPVDVTAVRVEDHWKLLLPRCFATEDLIWIGERYHSGEIHGVGHFRTREDWLSGSSCPGPLVCPSAFKPGTISRSNDSVIQQRSMVVESDVLSKDEVGAVFKWLNKKVGLELMAIVDTGNKSLHGWFVCPPIHMLEELKVVLPELGCDERTLHPSQPVRLPGYPRNDKFQHLVFLNNRITSQQEEVK